MSAAFAMTVDVASLETQLDADAEAFEAAARPAAQAGAQVFYDEVKRLVGRLKRHTGNLDASIYQAFSKDNSGPGLATYHISWNAKKAPHGHLVEYGHLQKFEVSFDPVTKRFTTHRDRPLNPPKQVAARPFVRPAFAVAARAQEASEKRLFEELEKAGVIS